MSVWLVVACALAVASGSLGVQARQEFTIANDAFMKDGSPFQLVSASFHYARVQCVAPGGRVHTPASDY